MVMRTLKPLAVATVLAAANPIWLSPDHSTLLAADAPRPTLWRDPADAGTPDLFNGPWGAAHAPRPDDVYSLVSIKRSGVNPGMTVRDSTGRKWNVKQASPDTLGPEGPIEVVLSRILSAVGYQQPPVYYLPSFALRDDWGVRTESGGRFRLHHPDLKERGAWSWTRNAFVDTRPYQGLLAILMIFNSSDLKDANNSIYEYRGAGRIEHWYVVRDLGTALGTTGRLAPLRGDPEAFARSPFILGIDDGFVEFGYRGRHQELLRHRLRPEEVAFGSQLLSRLSHQQWLDAFRAGGYSPPVAEQFIRALSARIAAGLALTAQRSQE